MSSLFETTYNPDVLSCIANLSSDEVFTPPELVNQMLDMLPAELWSDPDATFLDPACKSGVFLREIAKRLIVGLEEKIPDLDERLENIYRRQVFGIATTELTSLLARRSLYCSKWPNGPYSVVRFDNAKGNVEYSRIKHTWENGRCRYCGAAESEYKRDESLEQYAYEFIHIDNFAQLASQLENFPMKFDVIIGNPPYQLSDGGNSASAGPLYHYFVQQAVRLSPRYLLMIIPARWYAGGKGLDQFRNDMLSQKHIRTLVDYPNSADCFPGVNIAGGVCYFLWDRDHMGTCNVINMQGDAPVSSLDRRLDEYSYFVRNNTALSIIRKVTSSNTGFLSDRVFSRNYFGLQTTVKGLDWPAQNTVRALTSKGYIYVPTSNVSDKNGLLDKYKVIITYAMSGGNKPSSDGSYQVISSLMTLAPGEACSETYLILDTFDNKQDAHSFSAYVSTKFFRFLLLQALSSIHITKDKFCFVPDERCCTPPTDEELYSKYGLTDEEIAFIESMIRPMDLGGDTDAD